MLAFRAGTRSGAAIRHQHLCSASIQTVPVYIGTAALRLMHTQEFAYLYIIIFIIIVIIIIIIAVYLSLCYYALV